MGETGIGKTAIIKYLAMVMFCNLFTLNVHAGITEQSVI
jgi:MoxR-like ATPase